MRVPSFVVRRICGFLGGSVLGFFKRCSVRIKYSAFKHSAEFLVDRMHYVMVSIIGFLLTGHHDEILIPCMDNFNVMQRELTVKSH